MMARETRVAASILSNILAATVMTFTTSAFAANSATTPVSRDRPHWIQRHESMNQRVKQGNVDLLWIGDSIVENWENQGKPVWNKYYAHRNAVNLGISGDRTEQVLWRLDNGNIDGIAPKLAIVMIGQNNGTTNTAWQIGEGVTAIVNKLREKLQNTKILLLGIFFRGEKPNEERMRLASANEIAAKCADGKHVFYLDIDKIFLRPDGTIPGNLMPDFEHPSEEGHRIWAKEIEPKVAELFGDAAVQP